MTKKVLIPGTLGELAEGACTILSEQGHRGVRLGPITRDDIDCGLAHIDNDVCLPTIAVVGQCLRHLEEQEAFGDVAVLAPELCRDCRSVSVPDMLATAFARAGVAGVEVVPFSSAEARSAAPSEHVASIDPACPNIGVCGSLPMVTTTEFRRVACEHLEQQGCRVILPPTQRISDERDFLTPALQWFSEQGIGTVICILPFGCLGGHVFARGQLRRLQREFPDIDLTILDYDPSASEVNLVNRIELVLQTAKEKTGRS